MRFEEVLPTLREGKKIRRKERPIVTTLGLDDKLVLVSAENLLADDWEIIKERKKIKIRDLTEEQYVKWRKNSCCVNICASSCPFRCINCSIGRNNYKEMYSDKFLDQEIEVEEWLKKNI